MVARILGLALGELLDTFYYALVSLTNCLGISQSLVPFPSSCGIGELMSQCLMFNS